uniref:Uncharacterized protein n=1 Tax=Vitis vinifera TaxID=29760 RepID=A5C1Y8_VITVI|nr:hypothetical protein VITISV_026609 [Vitis vinifera]
MAFERQLHQAEGQFRTLRNWNFNVRNLKWMAAVQSQRSPTCKSDFATCELGAQRAKMDSKFQNQLVRFSQVKDHLEWQVLGERYEPLQGASVINFVDYSLNQRAPAGHESVETPSRNESFIDVACSGCKVSSVLLDNGRPERLSIGY